MLSRSPGYDIALVDPRKIGPTVSAVAVAQLSIAASVHPGIGKVRTRLSGRGHVSLIGCGIGGDEQRLGRALVRQFRVRTPLGRRCESLCGRSLTATAKQRRELPGPVRYLPVEVEKEPMFYEGIQPQAAENVSGRTISP